MRIARFTFTLTTAALMSGSAVLAQPRATPAAVPFTVGEELVYRATFAGVRAGTARMSVVGIDTVRGRLAYHTTLTIDGGVPGLRVSDRYDSWIDVETLSSLRYVQQISEGLYKRKTTYEIYPESLKFRKNAEPILPSVANALDELAFIYAIRAQGIKVGETRTDNRYFRLEGNPVVLTGVSVDTVTVGAGTFITTAVHPSIKTKGLFAENVDARVWFGGGPYNFPVKVRTKFAKFTVSLTLESINKGEPPPSR